MSVQSKQRRLPADLAPPYAVQSQRHPRTGETMIEIVSRDHVIGTVAVGPRYARQIAELIVSSCNARKP